MYKVRKISEYEDFLGLKEQWNLLVQKTESKSIFLIHEWADSWWQSFQEGCKLYILLVEFTDELVGIAPLVQNLREHSISFLGSPNADYGGVIGPDKSLICKEVTGFLLDNSTDWDKISLDEIPERISESNLLYSAFKNKGMRVVKVPTGNCFAFQFNEQNEARKSFRFKQKSKLQNLLNNLKKQGELTLTELSGDQITNNSLELLFEQHMERWKNTPTPSKFLNKNDKGFYVSLTRNLADQKRVKLYLLKIDDELVSLKFVFILNDTVYMYTPSYNIAYSKYSPGKLINRMLVEKLIRDGYSRLDFGKGDESYKKSFTNESGMNYSIKVFKSYPRYLYARTYQALKQSALGKHLIILKKKLMK